MRTRDEFGKVRESVWKCRDVQNMLEKVRESARKCEKV